MRWPYCHSISRKKVGGNELILNAHTIAVIAIMAVVASLGAYLVSTCIPSVLGDSPTAPILYLVPVYTMNKAGLFLRETLCAYHFAGAPPILLRILLSTRR